MTARGVTLLELLVALAVLGIGLGVAGLSVTTFTPAPEADVVRALEGARSDAARSGRAVTYEHDGVRIRFAPDGSARGGPVLLNGKRIDVDPITGRLRHETR